MNRIGTGSVALVVALSPGCSTAPTGGEAPETAALAPGDHAIALRHGGRARRYFVHVPEASRAGGALPVLLAFHGGGGNADGYRAYAGFDGLADREGFVVAYPDGTGPLRERLLTWNSGGCCGRAMEDEVDDVGFAIAVLDDLARRLPIDPARAWATGHSNGSMMAYRLAAERADRIAAIAPVAGAMYLDRPFAPAQPVAVLHIHSVDDPRALYAGGLGPPFPLTSQRVAHRPVQEGLDRWLAMNGCAGTADTVETRRGQAGAPDAAHTAVLLRWRCGSGYDVAHWKLTGAGHGWPGNETAELRESLIGPATTVVDAAAEVWAFVSRFQRAGR